MHRASLLVCALTVGLLPACDNAEATKAAESARKTAETKLAERDKEVAALKQEIAKLSEKPGDPAPSATPAGPSLDAEIVRAAGTVTGVQKIKLEAEADGKLRELALYHSDESALPPAVVALREQQYPGSKVRAYEIEFDAAHGRVFEVEVTTKDKQECEYSAKPDGTLVYNECHIDAKALSPAIQALIPKTVPGAKILEAEKKSYPDGRMIYSVELSAGGSKHELYFENDAVTRHELVFPGEIEVPAP
jgi:uncharacterized membrane protein YkoI